MPQISVEVTPRVKPERGRLPEDFGTYASTVQVLRGQGLLAEVEKRLRIQRRPGYAALDLLLVLLVWLTHPRRLGLRKLASAYHGWAKLLGALAGRVQLPSQPSVSRLLAGCEGPAVESFGEWLLTEALPLSELHASASVGTWCTRGERWDVFDYDPTHTTLRQRLLPEGEALPVARRRAAGLARAGYQGRKRGEVLANRPTVQHSGSGIWVGAWLSAGPGSPVGDLERACKAVARFCGHNGLSLPRVVLRMDGGAAPGLPGIAMCRAHGLTVLTRLSLYSRLAQPEVEARLREGRWTAVEDSTGGTRREALELGVMRLASTVRRSDGAKLEAAEIRVVLSRRPRAGQETVHGAGFARGEWFYEMFGTDLTAEHWPAEEVVALYSGRAVIENRFLQEDRELDLDRIASYALPGQHLTQVWGLFLWNLWTWLGARAQPALPGPTAAVAPRPVPPPEVWSPAPVEPKAAQPEKSPAPPPPTEAARLRALATTSLHRFDWPRRLTGHPGFVYQAADNALVCPAGKRLRIHKAVVTRKGDLSATLRVPSKSCRKCPLRASCLPPNISPHHDRSVVIVLRRGDLVDNDPGTPPRAPRLGRPPKSPATPEPPRWRPPLSTTCGPYPVVRPTLVPSVLRRQARQLLEASVRVLLSGAADFHPTPDCIAPNAAARQHRRIPWSQRLGKNALPESIRVAVRLEADHRLGVLVPSAHDSQVA